MFLTLELDEQIFGDPEAADIVFTCGADILAVGINVTHQVILSGNTLNLEFLTVIIMCFFMWILSLVIFFCF